MDEVKIEGANTTAMLINIIIDLHAKQAAQTNLLIDFLSQVSNISPQELTDSMRIRESLARKDFL